MSQLPRIRSTLCRGLRPGLLQSSSSQVRWRTDQPDSLSEGRAEKQMGFFEAADVLSKPPVKPKRLGFDFNLWMFIVALTPSAIIFVSAQLIRRMIRKEEKELQEKEKAEFKAKVDALQSEESQTFPRTVQSRGQRHAAEREERKLTRSQQYSDEKEVATLEGQTEANKSTSVVQGGQHATTVDNLAGKAKNGADEPLKTKGPPLLVQKESKGSPSDEEVQHLKAKVAELEQGLKSLEQSLQKDGQKESQGKSRGTAEEHAGSGQECASPIKEKASSSTGSQAESAESSSSATKVGPLESESLKSSLFDYISPHWLRRRSEAQQIEANAKTNSKKSEPRKPP